ncbi:MAG: hypothetical protein NDI82_04220 [Anaeromyxobacteraceae bacterium]|nr:hypothetical protein [Anaeromyxobacteraceae bacterium]
MTMNSQAAQALLGLGAVVLAVGAVVSLQARAEPAVKSGLQALSGRRVFFGHQSVGSNVLDGVRDLAALEGAALRVTEARASGVPAGTLVHLPLAENGDPFRKLHSFVQAFASGEAAGADLALMKFCYVDVTASTDVAALFAAYQRTVAEVEARSPGTTVVHVTVPLQTVEGGLKAWLKGLLGRPIGGAEHNARREAYNDLLRAAYQGRAPLFDLALAESTRPDGSAETITWRGRPLRALVPAYTGDGGHLNEEGRRAAARALVAALAAAPAPRAAP